MPIDHAFGPAVTIEMPLACAANTAIQLKARLHDLADLRRDFPDGPTQEDVHQCYLVALNAVNAVLPADMQQVWVREDA